MGACIFQCATTLHFHSLSLNRKSDGSCWIPVEADDPHFWDQNPDSPWKPAEIPLGDDRILVLESN